MTPRELDIRAAKMRLRNAAATHRRLMNPVNFQGRVRQLVSFQRSIDRDVKAIGEASVRRMVRKGQVAEEFVGGAL